MVRNVKLGRDRTYFCDFIGYSTESKILEYLLELRDIEFTFNDIITALSISRQKAYQILNYLFKEEIIIKSRKVKHISFYKLNTKNKQIKIMIQLFDSILDRAARKYPYK